MITPHTFFEKPIDKDSFKPQNLLPLFSKEKEKTTQLSQVHHLGINGIEKTTNLSTPASLKRRSSLIMKVQHPTEERIPKRKNSLVEVLTPVKKLKSSKKTESLEVSKKFKKREDLSPEQLKFFTEQLPSEWFSLSTNKKGKIACRFPSSLKKIKRVIYIFRNKETGRCLIGKTGQGLIKRCRTYIQLFNKKGSENKGKKKGRKAFLNQVKHCPENFEVGILCALNKKEDLDFFETCFIDCKRKVHPLYNDNRGGGGGLAHLEERITTYAVPKPGFPFTPDKYYPYTQDKQRRIRPKLTPGFQERVQNMQEKMQEGQLFAYVIKQSPTEKSITESPLSEKRYVGVTGDPATRASKHGYDAEYLDPQHNKYDPTRKSGCLHSAIAQHPEQFRIGLLPLRSKENISPNQKGKYQFFQTIAEVERYAIGIKNSLVSQDGFNVNQGGGGPIPRSAARKCLRQNVCQ